MARRIAVSAADLVRKFSHFSDLALRDTVVVTKHGRPRNILISYEEFRRLSGGRKQGAVVTPMVKQRPKRKKAGKVKAKLHSN